MKTSTTKTPRHRVLRKQRGSALLISLMVIVGLSLLGLGFVGISETESAISMNEKNATVTQAAAEAGARAAVEWFQDPTWAADTAAVMPPNNAAHNGILTTRTVSSYTGKYKRDSGNNPTTRFCDKPYKPDAVDRLYGDDSHADIIINGTTDPSASHTGGKSELDILNERLFGTTDDLAPKITDIRIYAPPIVGGSVTNGFYVGGTRYGVATVKATAVKKNAAGTVISSHTVRIVVGEFPLPVPSGPIQSRSTITLGGSFDVWWGAETSSVNLTDTKAPSTLPWANAWERPHFERGYEYAKDSTTGTVSLSPVIWPTIAGSQFDAENYLSELVGKSFSDPWFGQRSIGLNTTNCGGATNVYQCNQPYSAASDELSPAYSSFQLQTINNYPWRQMVTFPSIKYSFWKRTVLQGAGTKGLYYFTYVTGTTNPPKFKKQGSTLEAKAAYWVNVLGGAKLGAGVYFFDTTTGSDPQIPGGGTNTSILTPAESWSSSWLDDPYLAQGFIYFNMAQWGTTGAGNKSPLRGYTSPGEPFRDIGYWQVEPSTASTTGAWAQDPNCPPANPCPVVLGKDDGIFSYQDLNGNGRFDVVTVQASVTSVGTGGGTSNQYVVRTWRPGCTAPPTNWDGTNGTSTTCSEPHEPYLNLRYPAGNGWSTNPATANVTTGWESGAGTLRQKDDSVTCTSMNQGTFATTGASVECTSNRYDEVGGINSLNVDIDGVVYNEGDYDSQGNAIIYGSLLFGGAVQGTGTPNIYFDEKLLHNKPDWPGMPRVIIYAIQSDDVEQ